MKLALVFGITIVVALMFWYEWPRINKNQKKEKIAFVVLSALGWIIAVLLVFFPDIPGPTELVDKIYKPLGKMLE